MGTRITPRAPSASVNPPTTTTATPSTTAPTPSATPAGPNADGVDSALHNARHDMRFRVGVNAVTSGPTTTAVPNLLQDWQTALHQAAAEQLAFAEVIEPVLSKRLDRATVDKGEKLTRQEKRGIEHDVEKQLDVPFQASMAAHHKDLTKSPSAMKKTERDVLLEQRPRVAGLKDVFTPVIDKLPGARDNEIVLWESKNAMVVVDTFASSPKALVVPKGPLALPTDAKPGQLEELALIAAHVSDAFMRATGAPAAGIWVNPPQHLTVKQLHVHVLPDVGPFTADGAPAKAFIEDPQMRPQIEAWFAVIGAELANKLGPSP